MTTHLEINTNLTFDIKNLRKKWTVNEEVSIETMARAVETYKKLKKNILKAVQHICKQVKDQETIQRLVQFVEKNKNM